MKLPEWLTVIAVASALGACGRESVRLPESLLGTWITEAPPYEDRFFELHVDSLTFGTGGDSSHRNPIVSVEVTEKDGRSLYHIEHLGDEGQSYTFSFYYEPADGGFLTLKNQPTIHWKKERRKRQ